MHDIPTKRFWFDSPNRLILVVAAGLCFFSVAFLPLLDRTEGRTALVARSIGEYGNFFELKSMVGGEAVDYWAKPPFHYWLVHFSYQLFGENSFGARVPNFIAVLMSLSILSWGARRLWDRETGITAAAILLSSGMYFYVMGLCLVDTTLTATMTAGMILTILNFQELNRRKKDLLALGAGVCFGLGFDTKGPVAVALPVFALFIWFIWKRQWHLLNDRSLLISILSFLGVTLPVYILLEIHNPGFSEYFFLNENFLRFLVMEYGGRFGSGHAQPYGTSWLYLVFSFLPWTFLLFPITYSFLRSRDQDPKRALLLCWGLAPALFFTFARQHLATYLLPGFAGLALFIATADKQEFVPLMKRFLSKWLPWIGFGICILGCAFGVYWEFDEPYWPIVTLSLPLCALFLHYLLQLEVASEKVTCLLRASFFICLTFATLEISASHYIGDVSSTEDILSDIRSLYPNDKLCVRFPVEIPYSANMYEDKNMKLMMKECEAGLYAQNFMVIRKKDVAYYQTISGRSFAPTFEDGKWVVAHEQPLP